MRAIPFLAALLCTAPLAANAKSELELLQDRCAEMERQIRALETENSHLKSQASTSTKTVIETAKPAATPETSSSAKPAATEPTKAAAPAYATVRAGDTLTSVAKRNGTTSATLLKLNKLKNPSSLQIGQKLRLPDKAPAAVAKTSSTKTTTPAPAQGGTHIVKSGETFYSIAQNYGLSADALQAANPQIKADKLRAGQTLHLGAKPKSESAPATAKSKPTSEKAPAPAAAAPKTAAATAPAPSPSKSEAPAETGSQPVSNGSKLRLVVVEAPIDFGTFAANHGTSIARLNALNGHDLKPSTLIDKGSEFYVPSSPQP